MGINKIGLIGATGNLGPAILKALLDAGFEVTVLSREGSTSTDSLASHPRQKVVKTNFDDVNSITSALSGIQGLVSNVAGHALLTQKNIIDAAIAAGVTRFLPSEFGSDLSVEANARLPYMQGKVEITHYLEEKAKAHPQFSYSIVSNGPFFDWCLRVGLFGDLKKHEMTLWDGGDSKFTTTTLPSVGRAVVAVFNHLDATRNQHVFVADTTISQKEIMAIVKEIDGQEWTTKEGSTAEALQSGLDELKKPEPNMMVAVVNQLTPVLFSKDHHGNFSQKLDNERLGLPLMTPEQVKDVVRSCLA